MQQQCAMALLALLALLAPLGGARAARLDAGAAAALRVEPAATADVRPWFCHNLDCPEYTVVNATEDYELRYYEAGVWVSTDVEAYAYALAANQGFRRLFEYIGGANGDAVTIPMTSPVRTKVSAAAGPFCKNSFTVSFFLPPRFHKHPPKPNNPDVYVQGSAAFSAFVGAKGGFVMDDYSIAGMVKRLGDALDDAGLPFEGEDFFVASYDPPFRLRGRHTEVWLVAQEDGRRPTL